MAKKAPEVPLKDLAQLPATRFIDVRLNGDLRKKTKARTAAISISLPDDWAADLVKRFMHDDADYEYFMMKVKKSEIPG